MPRLIGINHVAVEVGDIDEALDFLGRIFERHAPRAGARHGVRRHGRPVRRAGRRADADAPTRTGTSGSSSTTGRQLSRRPQRPERELAGDNDFLDPWGNRWQVVDYRDVQFSKAPRILEGMGLGDLEKSERALAELRAKGLADLEA